MEILRKYGEAPWEVAVVHGGPGAGGEMAPVARRLGSQRGTLEPIQTAMSLEEQVEELRATLQAHGDTPVVVIGFSWGAWLSFILAARNPGLIKKLILVGSGPFREEYAAQLYETRLSRLSGEARAEFEAVVEALSDPKAEDPDSLARRIGALAARSDVYDAITGGSARYAHVGPRGELFQQVWREAAQMRRSGRLLNLGRHIRCPVVAIHGDYDPHPAAGVQQPLSVVLDDFRFILLEHCGHKPWIERHARDAFYQALGAELP